jgi:protein gp37
MNRTKIEYLDYTLTLISGCSGEGCAVRISCWALAMARRLAGRYDYPKVDAFKPTFHEDKFNEILRVKKPCRIGLNFMGETFDRLVNPTWLEDVLEFIERYPQHTFIILTKQPQNIPEWFSYRYLRNLWIGVSINRKEDIWRLDALRQKWFEGRIGSFEPLYEDLGEINLNGMDWIIIGAQTRPNFQPKPEWVYNLSYQASELGIPIFWKDNLTVVHGQRKEFPK